MAKSEELKSKLEEKLKELTRYRGEMSWRFFQGYVRDAHLADFDDSSWEPARLPMAFDGRKGVVWLRCAIEVPESVAGVDVAGSKIELFSPSVMTVGTEVFVDSKLAAREKYWQDFRIAIPVSVKAVPGERHVVAIRTFPLEGRFAVPPLEVRYKKVEKAAFEVDSFLRELEFASILPSGKEAVGKAVGNFDLRAFSDMQALEAELKKARETLSVLSKEAKEFKVHLIGHAHIDMNWLWPWENTVEVIGRDFETVTKLMEKHPDLRFSHSQAVTYKVAEEEFPRLFGKIREKVRAGSWDVTASMWVEPDLNMVGTEALVRQILCAKRYVKEKFGLEPAVCWEPDTFGHVWTLPQVLRKSGLLYYYFMRCGKGERMFWWEGPDGSKVLAFTSVYNNFVTPGNVVEVAKELYERYGIKTSMFVYGVGDHGGGPTEEDIESAREMMRKPTLPALEFSTTHKFYEEVSKEAGGLPTVRDELNFTFDGCYTTHAEIKKYNRLCERTLVDAEKFSCISGRYPREGFLEAWRKALFNQFHDILDGSGIPECYHHADALAEEALGFARAKLKDALGSIASSIKFKGEGVPIVVFNSLSWERKDVAKLQIPKHLVPRRPVLLDEQGRAHEVQMVGGRAVFIAEVPPLGYRTYYLAEDGARGSGRGGGASAAENTLENEFLKVELDPRSGTIISLFDKVAGRFALKRELDEFTMPVASNLFQVFYEAPHGMTAWIIGEITRIENLISGAGTKLLEKGPVMASIRVEREYSRSKISQDITIYSGVKRVDFDTRIEWKEFANEEVDSPMLRVSFAPLLKEPRATFEIPFGYVERVPDGREVPALRWVDVSDGTYGFSLLNDCKHGFSVEGNKVRMTLVRTSYDPDPRPDQGRHEILYSIYPHEKDWRGALTFRRGYELNHPLEAVLADASASGFMPEKFSFLSVDAENVVLSALKKAEDSEELVLRAYEAAGKGAKARVEVSLGIQHAEETDLMERGIGALRTDGRAIELELEPFEIKTVKLRTAKSVETFFA
ncbi:MAG: alpha-mannosidase [Candidatus Brockarchaeota archaeon]|nr:alpha-mannosidase [Candidatus Brockarchaeota archaeon]